MGLHVRGNNRLSGGGARLQRFQQGTPVAKAEGSPRLLLTGRKGEDLSQELGGMRVLDEGVRG